MRLASLVLSMALLGGSATVASAQQINHVLTWNPSSQAADVLEYHVFRNKVYAGATTAPGLTFAVTTLPGETVTFDVLSYGWLRDDTTGALTGEAGVGPWGVSYVFTEPMTVTVSADGTTCTVTQTGCQIVDTGLHLWTLAPTSWAVLRDGLSYFGGYGDVMVWSAGNIYVFNSTYPVGGTGSWWLVTSTGWAAYPNDPRTPAPPPPPPTLQCVWTDGTFYAAGQVSPTYSVPVRQWSAWYAQRQLAGWITNVGPNLTKNRKNYTGNLFCIGR